MRYSTKVVIQVLAIFLCLTAHRGHARAAETDGLYSTWAVISADDVQRSGLADLVTVSLSQMRGVQLVERDHIGAVDQEMLTSASLSADPKQRLALGRRVGADALLLLTMQNHEGSAAVRVVVCECRWK